MKGWRSIAAVVAGLCIAGSTAQTGTLVDLGDLLSEQKNLSTFYGLIQKYPQILLQLPSYKGVTVLAPNNDAFDKIPYSSLNDAFTNNDEDVITNVLEYHILQGTFLAQDLVPGTPVFIPTLLTSDTFTNVTGGQNVENVKQAGDVVVFVSGQGSRSKLVQPDLKFTGGVVQVIDSLLIPPTTVEATTDAFNLTSFEGAVYKAKKMDSISTTKNVTVFAANNAAFQALGSAITSMTSDELASVIDYQTLPQIVFSTALKNGSKFATKQGANITILQVGNNVYVNSAQLLSSDILIANGVLHVLDNVLNPQGPGAQPNPDIPTQGVVFASASSVADLPFTSAIPCTSDCPVSTTSGGSSSGTVTNSAGVQSTGSATVKSTSTFKSSSSKGLGAAMARETGFGAAGLMVALGGAVMMI